MPIQLRNMAFVAVPFLALGCAASDGAEPTQDEEAAQADEAALSSSPYVCVYENINYGGRWSCWSIPYTGSSMIFYGIDQGPRWCSYLGCARNDTVSSFKIVRFGHYISVNFSANNPWGGQVWGQARSTDFYEPWAGNILMNDVISSIAFRWY